MKKGRNGSFLFFTKKFINRNQNTAFSYLIYRKEKGCAEMNQEEYASRVERIKYQLYKTAYLYLGNESSALEAVDETIYKGLKNLKSLREPNHFTTWMTRILINECKREWNRQNHLHPECAAKHEKLEEAAYANLPLKEAVACLPNDLRMVIILRYFSDYTLSEAAESLGIPQGTVVTRQRKAVRLLKLDLAEVNENESE